MAVSWMLPTSALVSYFFLKLFTFSETYFERSDLFKNDILNVVISNEF